MQVVTIAATKGGVGKTTTAVCLALEAKARGIDVVLVDVDPQGSATQVAPAISTYLKDATSAEQITAAAAGHQLAFVDTPPGGTRPALAAIEAADIVVAVTGLGPGEVKSLGQLFRLVDPDLIVPTRRDGRRSIHALGLEQLRSNEWLAERVTDFVPASTSVEWLEGGRPLPDLSPITLAYRSVLDRVLAVLEDKTQEEGA